VEGINQLFGHRIGVAYIYKVESYHQNDENTLEEIKFFNPLITQCYWYSHACKDRKMASDDKELM
jgi:hypothetical protein